MYKKQGFTLIELLVVVLIIGILAAVALPQYQKAVVKARSMSLMPLIRSISEAETLHYLANGNYTLDFSDLSISMPAGAVQAEPDKITYQNFYCLLRTGDEDNPKQYGVFCNSTYANAPEIEKYFSRSEFICWGRAGVVSQQICKSISGLSQANRHWAGTDPIGYAF